MLHGILGNLTVMSRRLCPPRTIRSTPLPLCFVFLHTTRFSPHFFDFRSLCAHRSRIPSAPTLGYAYVRVRPLRDQAPHRGSTAYRLITNRDDPGSNPGESRCTTVGNDRPWYISPWWWSGLRWKHARPPRHFGIPFGHGAAGCPHTASPWSSTSSGLDAYHLHIFFIPLNRGSSTPR